jgi:hypothetical protein
MIICLYNVLFGQNIFMFILDLYEGLGDILPFDMFNFFNFRNYGIHHLCHKQDSLKSSGTVSQKENTEW